MKKLLLCLASVLFSPFYLFSQDTFSIVAVDSVSGEIGSAGASCIGIILPIAPHGAQIISDVIPGKGAIHTQAQYDGLNQQSARTRMLAGDSPQQIIAWLKANDAWGDSSVRQYGIVDFNAGHPRSSGFTGSGCMNYKKHVLGKNYAIQGNILLGQKILDSIESRFLNSNGTLADKLMEALQGANIVGADTRCSSHNTSSLSSFIRVAKPTDTIDKYSLDLYMSYENNVVGNIKVDPIDSLQTLYNIWKSSNGIAEFESSKLKVKLFYDDEMNPIFEFEKFEQNENYRVSIIDLFGKNILTENINQKKFSPSVSGFAKGIYFYQLSNNSQMFSIGKLFLK